MVYMTVQSIDEEGRIGPPEVQLEGSSAQECCDALAIEIGERARRGEDCLDITVTIEGEV